MFGYCIHGHSFAVGVHRIVDVSVASPVDNEPDSKSLAETHTPRLIAEYRSIGAIKIKLGLSIDPLSIRRFQSVQLSGESIDSIHRPTCLRYNNFALYDCNRRVIRMDIACSIYPCSRFRGCIGLRFEGKLSMGFAVL